MVHYFTWCTRLRSLLCVWPVRGSYRFWDKPAICLVSPKCPFFPAWSTLLDKEDEEDIWPRCISRVSVGHVQLNGAARGTRAARAAQLAHTSPTRGCSRRRVFSFCPSLLSPNCCTCHCLQWEQDRTRLAGFGQPLPDASRFCGANIWALLSFECYWKGRGLEKPASQGRQLLTEGRQTYHTTIYYYATCFAL